MLKRTFGLEVLYTLETPNDVIASMCCVAVRHEAPELIELLQRCRCGSSQVDIANVGKI